MDPVYLAAAIVGSLIQPLPAGTASFLGVVLITMRTGRLRQGKGSLARAVFPFVVHLRWGWHRAERALERGQLSVAALRDGAGEWCLSLLAVEPVRLGPQQRAVLAVASSTSARVQAVRATLVAIATRVVLLHGVRVGLVQRVRVGASCQEAVAHVCTDLPPTPRQRWRAVAAGSATTEQFAAAPTQDVRLGRRRRNCTLRCAPPTPHRHTGAAAPARSRLASGRGPPRGGTCRRLHAPGRKRRGPRTPLDHPPLRRVSADRRGCRAPRGSDLQAPPVEWHHRHRADP